MSLSFVPVLGPTCCSLLEFGHFWDVVRRGVGNWEAFNGLLRYCHISRRQNASLVKANLRQDNLLYMAKLLTLIFWTSLLLHGDNVPSKRNDSKTIAVSQMDERDTKARALVVAEDHKKTSEEIRRERANTDQHDHIERWMLDSSEATAGATIFLVLVGIGGTIAALCTLREIGRQSNLQSIPFKSWIALENWSTDFKPDADPLNCLRVSVDIVNQTDFPITIIEGQIRVKILGGPGYTRYELGERTFIPPKSPYAVIVPVPISDSHAATFNTGLFTIPIEGHFSHFGQLGEKSIFTQRFEGFL